jgi:signal transduction histidine kinase/DNA-binding response OmpR family regulator
MPGYKPLILIADDDPASAEVVRLFLVDQDYRFIMAQNGEQTLQLAREKLPDLILLDLNMPVMDGFTVLEKLREDQATRSIVVIIMTAAYAQRKDRLRAFKLGAHDYLLKPLDRRELAARVRSWLQTKTLENNLRQQGQELQSLYLVTQEIATTLNPSKLAQKLLMVAGQFIGAEDGWVILVNERGDPLHAVRYGETLPPQAAGQLAKQSLQQGVGSVVSRTQTGLLIEDSAVDERYATGELGLSSIRSIVSVPLLGRRHYRGVLTYAHPEPNRFTDRHLQWLRTVAGQAAVALDNAYLFAREQRRAVQSRLLNSVTQEMSSVLEMDRLLDVVVNLVQRTFSYSYVGLVLHQDGENTVRAVAHEDGSHARLLGPEQPEGVVAWVADHSQPLLINDVSKDIRYRPKESLDAIRSELALPIQASSGLLGVLDIRSNKVNAFEPDDVIMLETLSAQVSIAMQNAQLFRALSDQREQLNAILNSVPNAVLVADRNGRLLLANPAARRLLHLEEADLHRPLDPDAIPPGLLSYFTQPVEAGETVTGEFEDAEEAFQIVVSPVVVDGALSGRVVLLQDVTHFKELSRLKDEFVATVSHDLKNPLGVVKGAAFWLSQPDVTPERQEELIDSIRRSADRMNTLISQLLELGKLDSGIGLALEDVDLQPVLEGVIDEFQAQASEHSLALMMEAPPQLWVHADPDRIRQALSNLLSNAVKYTPAGGSIAVEAQPRDDHVLFKVQDTGLGIAPRDQPYVFDKFYRVQSADTEEIEGSGLGLAIVKSIVTRHGGRIWLESTSGEGSTFFFTLPRAVGPLSPDL